MNWLWGNTPCLYSESDCSYGGRVRRISGQTIDTERGVESSGVFSDRVQVCSWFNDHILEHYKITARHINCR